MLLGRGADVAMKSELFPFFDVVGHWAELNRGWGQITADRCIHFSLPIWWLFWGWGGACIADFGVRPHYISALPRTTSTWRASSSRKRRRRGSRTSEGNCRSIEPRPSARCPWCSYSWITRVPSTRPTWLVSRRFITVRISAGTRGRESEWGELSTDGPFRCEAISEGHGDTALLLLKAGAETDKKDVDGHLAIDLAPDSKVIWDAKNVFLRAWIR